MFLPGCSKACSTSFDAFSTRRTHPAPLPAAKSRARRSSPLLDPPTAAEHPSNFQGPFLVGTFIPPAVDSPCVLVSIALLFILFIHQHPTPCTPSSAARPGSCSPSGSSSGAGPRRLEGNRPWRSPRNRSQTAFKATAQRPTAHPTLASSLQLVSGASSVASYRPLLCQSLAIYCDPSPPYFGRISLWLLRHGCSGFPVARRREQRARGGRPRRHTLAHCQDAAVRVQLAAVGPNVMARSVSRRVQAVYH